MLLKLQAVKQSGLVFAHLVHVLKYNLLHDLYISKTYILNLGYS